MLMSSSSSVDIRISSAVMLFGMSMHDFIALMVMHMPGILSFCLSQSCIWIASLGRIAVAQACTVFLCCIGVFIVVFFEACLTDLQHFS